MTSRATYIFSGSLGWKSKTKAWRKKKKKISLIGTSRLQYANRLNILALKQTKLRKPQSNKSFGNPEPIILWDYAFVNPTYTRGSQLFPLYIKNKNASEKLEIYLNICSLKGIPGLKLKYGYNETKNSFFAGLESYLNFKSCTHIRRGCYDCYHKWKDK